MFWGAVLRLGAAHELVDYFPGPPAVLGRRFFLVLHRSVFLGYGATLQPARVVDDVLVVDSVAGSGAGDAQPRGVWLRVSRRYVEGFVALDSDHFPIAVEVAAGVKEPEH